MEQTMQDGSLRYQIQMRGIGWGRVVFPRWTNACSPNKDKERCQRIMEVFRSTEAMPVSQKEVKES